MAPRNPALCSSAASVGRSTQQLVALSEERVSVLPAGHGYLDFYAKIPFYANMFSNAGFQLTTDQTVPDALVDNLVSSGNEEKVAARINELLSAGLDELILSPVPVTGTGEDEQQQQARLMHLIGRL